MPDKSNPWAVTPDPALQEMFSNIFGDLEPLSRQCQEILEQTGCFQPLNLETQQLINHCQQICQCVLESETWNVFQQTATLITKELQRPEYQDFAKQACKIVQQALKVQQDFCEDSRNRPKAHAASVVDTDIIIQVEQTLPDDMRRIWLDVDNKIELITYALTMADILLSRLVIPTDSSAVKDGTEAVIFLVLFFVFLNILIRAYCKRIDKIRNKR